MAAMQSRAAQQYRPGPSAQAEDEAAVASPVSHNAAAGTAARGTAHRRRSVGLEQESWILFAPKQPAQPLLTGATAAISQTHEEEEEINPFSTSLSSDKTIKHPTSDSSWHLVPTSSSAQDATASSSTAVANLDPLVLDSEASAEATSRPVTSTSSAFGRAADDTHRFNWASLPKHEDSYFFSDDEEVQHGDGTQLQQSIYVDVPGEGSTSQKNDDGDTDMLSIPSSLSVSDRSTSSNAVSPRISQRSKSSPRVTIKHERSGTLTQAALEENSRLEEALAAQEAALTSGSEGEDADDPDETQLARAPDALSAGIKPSRRRQALGAIKSPSQAAMSVTSSQRSGIKRRHKQAGMSDKGSKRSHTSGEVGGAARHTAKKGKAAVLPQVERDRDRTFSLGQAARKMFAVDEEVLEMMAQPGSVFSQALPPARSRRAKDKSMYTSHGFDAFSAHIAGELGDTAYHHRLFQGFGEDVEASDSGEETETENPQHRQPLRQRQTSADTVTAEDDPHTAALGLHRSISMASIQHFLIESLYGSLPSGLLASERTDTIASLDLPATSKRTRSRPGSRGGLSPSDRSHSSSELFEQGRDSMYESTGSQASSSYWRRLLRSLIM